MNPPLRRLLPLLALTPVVLLLAGCDTPWLPTILLECAGPNQSQWDVTVWNESEPGWNGGDEWMVWTDGNVFAPIGSEPPLVWAPDQDGELGTDPGEFHGFSLIQGPNDETTFWFEFAWRTNNTGNLHHPGRLEYTFEGQCPPP